MPPKRSKETSATAASRVLANRARCEKADDDDRRNPGSERDERQEEVQRERRAPVLSLAHPAALSTRTTVKGAVCGGLMSKESPQCPTITSAGADRV